MEQHSGDLQEEDLSGVEVEHLDFEGKFKEGSNCDSKEAAVIDEVMENSDDKTLMCMDDDEGVPGPGDDGRSSNAESKRDDEDKGAAKLFASGDFRDKQETAFSEISVAERIDEKEAISAPDFFCSTLDEMFNDFAQEMEGQVLKNMTVDEASEEQIDDSDELSSNEEEAPGRGCSLGEEVQDERAELDSCGYYKEIKIHTEDWISAEVDPAVQPQCVPVSDLEKVAFVANMSGSDVEPERVEENAARLFLSRDYAFWTDAKKDEVLAEGRPSAHETQANPQVRNKSVSYIKSVPGWDCEMRKGDETEVDVEKKQAPAGSRVLVDRPGGLAEHLEGLIAEGHVDEFKDFSGEDFQEAGEMYAELSSDLFGAGVSVSGDGHADLRDVYLEMNTSAAEVEVIEGQSSSSSEDEIHERSDKVSEDNRLVSDQGHGGEDAESPKPEPLLNVVCDFLLSEEPENTNTMGPSDSVRTVDVMDQQSIRAKSSTDQGSLDDSFFFNTGSEKSGKANLEAEDDNDEERNWEQEQERIKAFYRFYDDSDEDSERPGRMIKVQFSPDPLSQVIHYQTDSDSESFSSSEDGNDLSPAKTSDMDSDETALEAPALMDTEEQEQKPEVKPKSDRKHKCPSPVRLLLRTSVVVSVGLLALWFAIKHLRLLQPF